MPIPSPADFRNKSKKHSEVREMLAQMAEDVESKVDATTKANAAEANAKAYADTNKLDLSEITTEYVNGNRIGVKSARYVNLGVNAAYVLVGSANYGSVVIPVREGLVLFIMNDKQDYNVGLKNYTFAFYSDNPNTNRSQSRVVSTVTAEVDELTGLSYRKTTVPKGANYLILNTRFVSDTVNWTVHAGSFSASYDQGEEVISKIGDSLLASEEAVIAYTDAKTNEAISIASNDATTKVENFSKQLNTGSVKQGEFQNNTSGLSVFVVSDRRGIALFASDQSAVSVSNKYDLTTVKFHGSSTMRYMQSELFTKLKNEFKQIRTAIYTNKNGGGTLNDLATEIGINDGLLKFTDNKIYAAAPSPVVGVGLKYSLPATYDIPISLTNGFKGTLKSAGFIASNVTSDFELPVDLEINFKSDMTDYANCVSILNIGKNNMSGSNTVVVNNIVGMTRDAVTFLDKENGGRTLVIGHTTNRGSNADFVKNVKDVNAQLKALYFNRYFGLFDYIFSDEIWIDTGLTKSADDVSAIDAETLPPSFTNDGIHLNSKANSAVTTKIVQFIQTLGWY